MNSKTLREIIDTFYEIIRHNVNDTTLMPGENLRSIRHFTTGIFIISLVFKLFNIFVFIDWRGALIAAILLNSIYYIGKGVGDD